MAIDENVALVGGEYGFGNYILFIYNRINGVWSYQATVLPVNGASEIWFGTAALVSSSFGVIVAGSPDEAGVTVGSSFVFSGL